MAENLTRMGCSPDEAAWLRAHWAKDEPYLAQHVDVSRLPEWIDVATATEVGELLSCWEKADLHTNHGVLLRFREVMPWFKSRSDQTAKDDVARINDYARRMDTPSFLVVVGAVEFEGQLVVLGGNKRTTAFYIRNLRGPTALRPLRIYIVKAPMPPHLVSPFRATVRSPKS